MRKYISNRLPQEYKKLKFYISMINNKLDLFKLKEYLEYTTIKE